MQNFKFGGVTVLAVQLFNKIKRKKEEDKEHEKTSFTVFPGCYVKKHLFFVNLFFVYVLDIDVTRNGNNLKLKVKSEFSLSMGMMLINHSNPYIHSTTVLCDIYVDKSARASLYWPEREARLPPREASREAAPLSCTTRTHLSACFGSVSARTVHR